MQLAALSRQVLPRSVPAARLARVRTLVLLYGLGLLAVRMREHVQTFDYPASAFRPVGVIAWFCAAPLPAWGVVAQDLLAAASGAAWLGRRAPRLAALAFASLLWWALSYGQSFGMILHTDNLVLLHTAALALGELARPAPEAPGPPAPSLATPDTPGWPLAAMTLITLASYWVAGYAKIRLAGWEWLSGAMLREQIAYDALRKLELGGEPSPLASWLLPQSGLLLVLGSFAACVELGAPLALLGRRAARLWCACAWAFHVGVLATMAIAFVYPLLGLAFVSTLRPETWARSSNAVAARARSGERPASA